MMKQTWRFADKSAWGDGPWLIEPDRCQWRHRSGLTCLALRNMLFGFWCGYVAVPNGHPAYERHYDALDLSVHGGLTFSDHCQPAHNDPASYIRQSLAQPLLEAELSEMRIC